MAGPSKVKIALEAAALATTTIILLVVFITNGLAAAPNADKYGFRNTTGDISDEFYTQVTPAGFTFSIWGVIYTWQALWIVYAWTFTCRPNAQRTIFTGVYLGYGLVNICNIIWIYVWGNAHIVPACVILILYNAFFYPTIGMLFGYFYTVKDSTTKYDKVLTYVLPINGLCFYVTWTTIASLINLTTAATSTTDISEANMATIALTILLVVVLLYFVLDVTILDRFGFRYVFSTYPVVIWALIGVLSVHWGNEGERRNSIYTLVLLVLTVILYIVKLVLVPLFIKFRPILPKNPEEKKIQLDKKSYDQVASA